MRFENHLGFLFLVLLFKNTSSKTIDQTISAADNKNPSLDFPRGDGSILTDLDMIFTRQQLRKMERANIRRRVERHAVRWLTRRWTKQKVPYLMSATFNSRELANLRSAIADWQTYTCLRFRQANSRKKNYIVIQDGYGCSAHVGMIGGRQNITLAAGCRTKGTIIHEIGHAIGFWHTQSRPDRDRYVTVIEKNVKPGKLHNFHKYSWAVINTYNVPYDYTSIMHYGRFYFSKNGKATIVTKDKFKKHVIGNRHDLSFRDIKLANMMYGCNSHCKTRPTCPGEGFVGKDCLCWCPGNPVKYCRGGGDVSVCEDFRYYCLSMARDGYCTDRVYKKELLPRCKKSCGVCSPDKGQP